MYNNSIYLIGEVGHEITLQSVIDQINETDKTKPLNVHIHSQGGAVYDGLSIYNLLKGLDQEVHTHSSGLVASIASIIFLAGKKETRKINSTDSFLIHLPSGMNWGNAEDLEKTAEELREIEIKLSNVYESETDLTASEALELMKDNKFLDVEFLKEKGFVNEIIEFKAVAKFGNKENMSEQLTKKEALGWFEKLENLLKPKNTSEEQAPDNKIVQDANGVEIDFFNLTESDTPKKDDEARIDNAKASGDYVMPSGETYKFDNGILNEIVDAETVETVKAELQVQKDLVATLETKLTEKDSEFETIKNEFTELKNTVTSNFEHENKQKQPKEEVKSDSRTSFKSKFK